MNDDVTNGYQDIAQDFLRLRRHSTIGADIVAEWSALLPPGGTVLDIGCGGGEPISETLLARGFKVSGVDASPAMVEAFRARFPDVPIECAPALESEFLARGTFDGIVSWGLFFLLDAAGQQQLIVRIANALPVGGHLLFTAPSQSCTWADSLTGRTSLSLGREQYREWMESVSLRLIAERVDQGENHHYFATKIAV